MKTRSLWQVIVTVALLSSIFVFFSAQRRSRERKPRKDYLELVRSPKEKLEAVYKLRPLDATKPDDALILSTHQEVNAINLSRVPVFWGDCPTAMGFPWGIVLPRVGLEVLRKTSKSLDYAMGLYVVLAHEAAHGRVISQYTDEQLRSQPVRVRELQAHLLSVNSLVWLSVNEKRQGKTNITQHLESRGYWFLFEVAQHICHNVSVTSSAWEDLDRYPRPDQTEAAFGFGLAGGWHYYDFVVWTNKLLREKPEEARTIFARIAKDIATHGDAKLKWPTNLLPRIDTNKLTIEEDIHWSHRVATRLAADEARPSSTSQ